MDTSWLALQVERVERSVAFLRQDQLALLDGLHHEILSLQKRCTDLTCELELQPPRRTLAEVEAEEECLIGRCEQVELRLEEEQWTVGELQEELSQKGELVRALRCSLREEERRFLQELKERSHVSAELHRQLHIQTEAVARLTFQLHNARHHLHHQHLQWPPALSRNSPLSETPPLSPKSPQQRQAVRAERARECVPRERVTAPEDPTTMPDPALFLPSCRSRSRPLEEQAVLCGEGSGEDTAMGGGHGSFQMNSPDLTRVHQSGSWMYGEQSSLSNLEFTSESCTKGSSTSNTDQDHERYTNESSSGDLDLTPRNCVTVSSLSHLDHAHENSATVSPPCDLDLTPQNYACRSSICDLGHAPGNYANLSSPGNLDLTPENCVNVSLPSDFDSAHEN